MPAGFLCGWPVGVELVAGLPERPGSQQRHFLQALKYVSVRGVLISSAHYSFYDDALYKSTFYLLTYFSPDAGLLSKHVEGVGMPGTFMPMMRHVAVPGAEISRVLTSAQCCIVFTASCRTRCERSQLIQRVRLRRDAATHVFLRCVVLRRRIRCEKGFNKNIMPPPYYIGRP